jgi:hypothetical protein
LETWRYTRWSVKVSWCSTPWLQNWSVPVNVGGNRCLILTSCVPVIHNDTKQSRSLHGTLEALSVNTTGEWVDARHGHTGESYCRIRTKDTGGIKMVAIIQTWEPTQLVLARDW